MTSARNDEGEQPIVAEVLAALGDVLPNEHTSLHLWKDRTNGATGCSDDCQRLIQCWNGAVLATRRAVPKPRVQPYTLKRSRRKELEGVDLLRECHWEEAVWRSYWTTDVPVGSHLPWRRILSYQMMLRSTNKDKGWGEVDLIVVDHQDRPVVIEVKKHDCTESPARMVIEACAYAIAIQELWPQFGPQFWAAIRKLEPMPPSLPICPVVCLAPETYWTWCSRTSVIREGWPFMKQLQQAASTTGLQISFATILSSDRDSTGLPLVRDVQPWNMPPD